MLSENKDELERSGVLRWHELGYRGQDVLIVVLDGSNFAHWGAVEQVLKTVAPEAQAKYFQYIDGGNQTEAIDWILANRPDVVNCSFGGYMPDKDIERLKDSGIPVICASGNDAKKEARYPAEYDWTISVGAFVDSTNDIAPYSNGDNSLDCVGFTNIRVNVGSNTYTFDGTSCATPFISGMLGIYLGYLKQAGMPTPTVEDLRQFIHKNAVDVRDKGPDLMSGYGLFVLPVELPKVPEKSGIEILVDEGVAVKDGQRIPLIVKLVFCEDRVMLGIRDLANLLCLQIDWDNEKRVVTISEK